MVINALALARVRERLARKTRYQNIEIFDIWYGQLADIAFDNLTDIGPVGLAGVRIDVVGPYDLEAS